MPSMGTECGDLCKRIRQQEPSLPAAPTFTSLDPNPCLRLDRRASACLPSVLLLHAWHSLASAAMYLPSVSSRPSIQLVRGQCFNQRQGDRAVPSFLRSFGAPPGDKMLVHACDSSALQWYPAFAGRYLKAWNDAYGPCKSEELEKLRSRGQGEGDYYSHGMWSTCRPRALAAHDAAAGTGGTGSEATPPYILRQMYGHASLKVVMLLRNPVDRLETSFWIHPHYPMRYGPNADGLHRYVTEQMGAFLSCEASHGTRRAPPTDTTPPRPTAHTCTYPHTRTCAHPHTRTRTHPHTHTRTYTHPHTRARARAHTNTRTRTLTRAPICIHP